jgi:hypothetical protein
VELRDNDLHIRVLQIRRDTGRRHSGNDVQMELPGLGQELRALSITTQSRAGLAEKDRGLPKEGTGAAGLSGVEPAHHSFASLARVAIGQENLAQRNLGCRQKREGISRRGDIGCPVKNGESDFGSPSRL